MIRIISLELLNSFKENLINCVGVIENGGLILYPTETVWAIGCDATNPNAVDKILKLKELTSPEGLVSLIANQFMLEQQIDFIPAVVYDIIDIAEKPTTVVLDNPKTIAKNVRNRDGSAAIRVTSDKFCQYAIGKFRKPIIATIANLENQSYPKSFQEIDSKILKGVDYVVNLQTEMSQKLSSIIKIGNDNMVRIIRK
ncbi:MULTISPECIES: L-threonylcarbamoyladenylate synthase [Croceitalea]|uniref:L-threonylcarbamoyladenylate synthase n=1 Tax=Croceitalea vernalis TaxID=3075599 RepID=A0ABU3BJ13_9FLAO|nr:MULTISPECIES: Sua5/YciO/YrdC/YwlC family protein [unclassified Croceitalea]MDT0540299.1 Sua5/YciO/YrdC/YwlC family protein [Croceitalea sp. P059]MDT0622134.1 Sua5/YciO/YrdC/YwlC family protein [Croceitalea sp. P007]